MIEEVRKATATRVLVLFINNLFKVKNVRVNIDVPAMQGNRTNS